jgi:UDP-glucose 4-epimerase
MTRVLITGISSHWGGRLAQELEGDREIEAIVGVDTSDPRVELERTEFVRVDIRAPLLSRILAAAAIDTVLDTRLITDPLAATTRAHQVNVHETGELLEACERSGSAVKRLIFKSSARYYGSEPDDPAFFSEEMTPKHPARTPIERDIVGAEQALSAFTARNRGIAVTTVRVASEIGASRLPLLGLPAVPAMVGFDPRCQYIHESDVVGALVHVTRHQLSGIYNAAADGVLALSEVASLLGKPFLPLVPPWGTTFAAAQLKRLGIPVPVESVHELRFGRGLDNRRLKAAGYAYRYTTRESVLKLRAQQRLRPLLRGGAEAYRYEREVQEFLRRSPNVVRAPEARAPADDADGPSIEGYDQLSAEELVGLIASLEPQSVRRLRAYEAAHRGRREVLDALDRRLRNVESKH